MGGSGVTLGGRSVGARVNDGSAVGVGGTVGGAGAVAAAVGVAVELPWHAAPSSSTPSRQTIRITVNHIA